MTEKSKPDGAVAALPGYKVTLFHRDTGRHATENHVTILPFNRFHPVTSVPTFSPITTRLRLCGRNKSKTIIGILLSIQSENAVESITLSCCLSASR